MIDLFNHRNSIIGKHFLRVLQSVAGNQGPRANTRLISTWGAI